MQTGLEQRREQIRRKLEGKNKESLDVDRIVRTRKTRKSEPIDRAFLFYLLAAAVVPHPPAYRNAMLRRQDKWKSLARRLKTDANRAERLATGHFSYFEAYALSLDDSFRDAKHEAPQTLFRAMRAYADFAHHQARLLGAFLRKMGEVEKRNVGAMNLLIYVQAATGKLCENELARLLTEAHELAGSKTTFSAGQLRKVWERHVLPLLQSYEQIQSYGRKFHASLDNSTP